MMQPKRTKYRKQFKGDCSGSAHRGSSVSFGEFALKSTERGRMTSREIEAARRKKRKREREKRKQRRKEKEKEKEKTEKRE